MSLRIIRQGVFDTLQDDGRTGYQHLGINPNGTMDRYAAHQANALLGKKLDAPVIEMHFPAPQIQFTKEAVICLTGAHFAPTVNGGPIPARHPVIVNKNTILKFEKLESGSRCYLAIAQEWNLPGWMNSYSTNVKAAAGGWQGRILLKNDVVPFVQDRSLASFLNHKDFVALPWQSQQPVTTGFEIKFLLGSEWYWMNKEAQETFQTASFQITIDADRMGYKLAGPELVSTITDQLVSSGVSFGTVQLLPNGQLIILMADHQTTGGYPRIAHIISGDLPLLAQKKANDVIWFRMTDLETAEQKIVSRQKYLHQLQMASKFRMQEYFGF